MYWKKFITFPQVIAIYRNSHNLYLRLFRNTRILVSGPKYGNEVIICFILTSNFNNCNYVKIKCKLLSFGIWFSGNFNKTYESYRSSNKNSIYMCMLPVVHGAMGCDQQNFVVVWR